MIATLIAIVASLAQTPQPPAGTIRGYVFDRDTGRPLLRANVRVIPYGITAEEHIGLYDKGDERIVMTDERGAFTIGGLPPGRYSGGAAARQHQPQPLREDAIVVGAGEVVDVVVRLAPLFGIDVRVVDPSGDPLSGLDVQVVALDGGQAPFFSMPYGTDDLGHLRVFGLPSGRYVICANTLSPGNALGAGRGERLLRTCYPSNDEANAQPVRLDRADVEGIELRMRRGRTFRVSGTVVDAAGAPAPGARVDFMQLMSGGGVSSGVPVDSGGRFQVVNVPSGTFEFRASLADPDSPARTAQVGIVNVDVADGDIGDLVVSMKKAVDVQGRLVVEDGVTPLPSSAMPGLVIEATLAGSRQPFSSGRIFAFVERDPAFTLSAVFGARELSFDNVPRGWYVKAVRYGDRDVIDAPVEFADGRDAPLLTVVLSNRGAMVTGTVSADDGVRAREARVYLMRLGGSRGGEVVGAARTTAAGAFTLGPVRSGEYALVALSSALEIPPYAFDRLKRLAALGERVTLTDLDERSVSLRIVQER